ncbi:hypothetical protein AVEN_191075-1 [Araneus ventricosus]|uniref:Uncharacterized protein n=1 Tax=Araneus ventricosus TaxID=182803 RepID=A0A4Y2AX23_ARAVE|nr:hypothetical protein AVEN_191075-1 [Araneus ventricosus]
MPLTVPESPYQNGVSERMNQALMNTTRSNLDSIQNFGQKQFPQQLSFVTNAHLLRSIGTFQNEYGQARKYTQTTSESLDAEPGVEPCTQWR